MYSSTGRAGVAVTSYLRFNHSRVTVLGLLLTVLGQCVCLSVCLRLFSDYRLYGAAYERYQQLQCYKGMKIILAILLKRLRSRDMGENKRKINMHNEHWLTRPGLARSAHRGRIIPFIHGATLLHGTCCMR